MRAQARQQHAEAERLGDIVVGAGVEAENGVGVGVGAGQHDDRHLDAVAPHQPAGLAPVHVGQADVEQDGVVVVGLQAVERRGAGLGAGDVELLVKAQLFGQGVAQLGIVVDDQNLFAVLHRCALLHRDGPHPAARR
jgi:hypothetical protein